MSALCPLLPRKRTFARRVVMSAKCQKQTLGHLFDHLVGYLLEMHWYVEAQSLSGLHIDHQLVFRWLLHR